MVKSVKELRVAYEKLKDICKDVSRWTPPYSVVQVHGLIQNIAEVAELLRAVETRAGETKIRMELFELIHTAGKRSEGNLVALEEYAFILEAYLSDEQIPLEQVARQVNKLRHCLNQAFFVLKELIETLDGRTESTVDIAILTVLPEEYKAIHYRLVKPSPVTASKLAPDLYAWVLGEIPNPRTKESYSVTLGMKSLILLP